MFVRSSTWILLAIVALSTVAYGLYFQEYFVLAVVLVWSCIEGMLWKIKPTASTELTPLRFGGVEQLSTLYRQSGNDSYRVLEQRVDALLCQRGLSAYEEKWLTRIKALS